MERTQRNPLTAQKVQGKPYANNIVYDRFEGFRTFQCVLMSVVKFFVR